MNLDHVFKKTTKGLYHTGINPSVPDDLLCKCKKCGGIVLNAVKFKLVLRMFAVIKRGTPYVETDAYKN